MSNDRLKYLLQQFAADASTASEINELFRWIRRSNDDGHLKEKVKELWDADGSNNELPNVDWDAIYTRIIQAPVVTSRIHWWQYAAAAAILFAVAFSAYLWVFRPDVQPIAQRTGPLGQKNVILPGGEKAVLTLADGTHIVLDSTDAGMLTQQGNMKVVKLSNGQLSYQVSDDVSPSAEKGKVLFNTIATPRGGQYTIELADGSRVWLNAASSLKFPAAFNGDERNVELTGEGYFEIAHNAAKPFKVTVNNVAVKVLGTHFNIEAYSGGAVMKTTLLEGSVQVEASGQDKTIKPGEQAQISNKTGSANPSISVQQVNVEDIVAWKEGRFVFHNDNIQTVMNQLARWYDVTVSYEGNVTNEEFVGVISRSRYENISGILTMLEKTRTVSFQIKGRHVTVMPFKK